MGSSEIDSLINQPERAAYAVRSLESTKICEKQGRENFSRPYLLSFLENTLLHHGVRHAVEAR
ncbi:MAG: hypothetical protein RR288_01060, partial [Oscillibacter sp.]